MTTGKVRHLFSLLFFSFWALLEPRSKSSERHWKGEDLPRCICICIRDDVRAGGDLPRQVAKGRQPMKERGRSRSTISIAHRATASEMHPLHNEGSSKLPAAQNSRDYHSFLLRHRHLFICPLQSHEFKSRCICR